MDPLFKTLAYGAVGYVALVFFLRLTGKRTLSKLNAFDLVITVAIGSTLSSILLATDTSLGRGILALLLLVLLQFAVAWLSVRWSAFARIVRAEPTQLLLDGEPCHQAMLQERVTESELRSAVRSVGGQGLADAEAVHLESDGSLSVRLRPQSAKNGAGPA